MENSICNGSIYIDGKGNLSLNSVVSTMNIENSIDRVIFSVPATVVIWKDGTKTVVKCQEGDTYSKELGLSMCIIKKMCGNKGMYNNIFNRWCNTPVVKEKKQKFSYPNVGSTIYIMKAEHGALGANGEQGIVQERNKKSSLGLYPHKDGIKVKIGNTVWNIGTEAKYKVIK